jgi:DNA primase
VIVAEGYTDVLMLHQAGLKNTVGIMGTAMTPEQVAELARLAPTVLLALDADSAGQEAMLRAERLARQRKLSVRVVPLPAGSDPADLVQSEGAAAVAALVDASIPFVRFRVEKTLAAADTSSAEGKDAVIDELRPAFAPDVLPPSALREDLLKEIADHLDLVPSMVSSWLAAGAPRRTAAPVPSNGNATQLQSPPHSSVDAPEREFLAYCIARPDAGQSMLERIDVNEDLSNAVVRRAHAHLLRHLRAPGSALPAEDAELVALIAALNDRAKDAVVTNLDLDAQFLALRAARAKRQLDGAPAGEKAEFARHHQDLENQLRDARDRADADRRVRRGAG